MGWEDYLAAGVQGVGAGLMGQDGNQPLGNLHLVNPAQQALYNTMAQRLMSGGGDFGFGSAYKQGKGQLSQMMAQRGISPQSGVAVGAMGDMTANAVGQDAQNRRNTWFQLMGQPLQTAQVAGANFVPGSLSRGVGTEQQANMFNNSPYRAGYNDPLGRSALANQYLPKQFSRPKYNYMDDVEKYGWGE